MEDRRAEPQSARRCLVRLGDTEIALIQPDGSGGVLDDFLGARHDFVTGERPA